MRTKTKKSFNKEIFGERIKTLREKSGMIQADAAREIKRTRSSYVIIEGGKVSPSADCIVDIVDMFKRKKINVSLDYLFGLTDHMNEASATLEFKIKYESILKENEHLKLVNDLQNRLLSLPSTKKGSMTE